MKLAKAKHADGLRKNTQVTFGGYNALGVEGEICNSNNMTSDYAPELASRPPRKKVRKFITGLMGFGAGDLIYRYGGSNLQLSEDGYNYTPVTVAFHIPQDECEWEGTPGAIGSRNVTIAELNDRYRLFAQLGDLLAIWPECSVVDLKTKETSYIRLTGVHNVYTMIKSEAGERSSRGNAVRIMASDTPVTYQANGQTVEDAAAVRNLMYRVGDAVKLSGAVIYPENNVTAVIRELPGLHEVRDLKDPAYVSWDMRFDDDTLRVPNHVCLTLTAGTIAGESYYADIGCTDCGLLLKNLPALAVDGTIYVKLRPGTGDTYAFADIDEIRVGGTGDTVLFEQAPAGLDSQTYQDEPDMEDVGWLAYTSQRIKENVGQYAWRERMSIEREAPPYDIDVLFAHENRLFAAKGDTIYISAWGDPYNWNVFEGLASDSFTTETGTPGDITGGIAYGGYPRFFKEDRVFTLFGDYPGEYQLVEHRQLGVMAGCGASLAIGAGRLFYLSPYGPCVYAGGEPSLMAAPFGIDRYKNGTGASDDRKYYLNMQDMDSAWHLFVYDLRKGLWMHETGAQLVGMCRFHDEVWQLKKTGYLEILGRPTRYPAEAADETNISWFAEFGDIAYNAKNRSWSGYGAQKKRITKLMVRLETEEGCSAAVKLKFDSESDWRTVSTVSSPVKRSWLLPIIPRRIDHFRLRIEGTGQCRICSISIETEGGSER